MATQHKQIGTKQAPEKSKGTYLTHENWEVMKPFVHFAFKAVTVIWRDNVCHNKVNTQGY